MTLTRSPAATAVTSSGTTMRQSDAARSPTRWEPEPPTGSTSVTVVPSGPMVTTPRRKFPIYLLENNTWQAQKRMAFSLATDEFKNLPRTITYVKKGDFWEALGFGAPTDDEQLQRRLIA